MYFDYFPYEFCMSCLNSHADEPFPYLHPAVNMKLAAYTHSLYSPVATVWYLNTELCNQESEK